MSKSIPRPPEKMSFSSFLLRYHFILYFLVIAIGFASAVWYLNSILSEASEDTSYTSTIGKDTIDTTTLDRINTLRESSDVTSLPNPPQNERSNPFGE